MPSTSVCVIRQTLGGVGGGGEGEKKNPGSRRNHWSRRVICAARISKSRVTRGAQKATPRFLFSRDINYASLDQPVSGFSRNLNRARNNSAFGVLFVLLDRLRSNHTLLEYNMVIKRDTLCSVSRVPSCNLCRYLSRCPYLSRDMYTKARGDVLISSGQDEPFSDATQTPDSRGSLSEARTFGTCRKRDYIINNRELTQSNPLRLLT